MSKPLHAIELDREEVVLVLRALDGARGEWPLADNDTAVNLLDYIETETGIYRDDE